jgi:peptidoglycan-associated lipoprotein
MCKEKTSKLLSIVFAAAFLAACGSSDDEGASAATSDTSATSAPVETTSTAPAAALEYVFYFDFDQATVREDSRTALDAQAARLRGTSAKVRLEGHADERGTREYNLALGERRAKAIANYLSVQGVDAANVEVVSYGEEKPVAAGHDDDSWSKNRRVELKDL